jgi:hypothetical protein
VLTLEILNPGCKEAGKNSEQWRISDRPKSKPTEVALKLVGCQLSGKREEGTGNREVVRSQESGVSYPLSGKNDARKSGDRTQENPSIWRKIMQIYG